MREIPLRNRAKEVVGVALVDDEDYERVNSRGPWCMNRGYARRVEDKKPILMHRFILGLRRGDPDVDHDDHNKLNNQKANLKPTTNMGNHANRRPVGNKNNTSGYRGVYASGKRWIAMYSLFGTIYRLGTFDTAEAASLALEAHREERLAGSAPPT